MCFYSEVDLCFPEKSWNVEIHVSVEKLSFLSMKILFWLKNGINILKNQIIIIIES